MRAKLALAVGAGAAALAAYAAAIAYLRDRRWKSLVRTRDRPKLKIGYWAIRGLAAPLRMAAAYGGLAYESVETARRPLAKGLQRGVAEIQSPAPAHGHGAHAKVDEVGGLDWLEGLAFLVPY